MPIGNRKACVDPRAVAADRGMDGLHSPLLRTLRKWHDRTLTDFEGVTSLEGPVESIDGKLMLRIPLAAGGARLRRCVRGISYVDDHCLNVIIPDWLAEKLHISDGSIIVVDNRDGRFNITCQWEALR
jgi:hypothetical protein